MAKKKKTVKAKEASTVIKEGTESKGGVNEMPVASPPLEPPKGQEVPPRATESPVVAKKGAPPQQIPLPKFPPEEIEYLRYVYNLLQNFKHRAGFSIEGTPCRFHDLDLFAKPAAIAVQRTELLNKLIDKIERVETELKQYKEKYGNL